MRATYQITEYGSFVRDKEIAGCISLPYNTFDALENFILANRSKETDALELMGLSARKGIGKIITAKNYVGVISMNDGTTIEILPKIYSREQTSDAKVKKLLVDMLKTLRNSPYKSLQQTNVDVEKMSIFEVFIRMFIDEVFSIVKKGLKCSYQTIQENETMFKGKMIFNQQIKNNIAHKERCFVEYDEYNTNRPENKLIKSALLYLSKITISAKNKSDIKTLLCNFSEVSYSDDYKADFEKVTIERNRKDYETALMWCRVFLTGKSFTSFSGSEIAFALLFPMETLFESYIAAKLRKELNQSQYSLSAQDKSYHLFDAPSRKFLIKPDIVVKHKQTNTIFILDTKWKVLSDAKPNYGISQADMYQMYAYQKKYDAKSVTLLYPLTEKLSPEKIIEFYSKDEVTVKVRFVDLFDLKQSLKALMNRDFIVQGDENANERYR